MSTNLTVVGGGLGGLVSAIAAREAGLEVRLVEAKRELGGRARSTPGPYVANWGPHALYADGAMWKWLDERGLAQPCVTPPLRHALLFHCDGRPRRLPGRVLLMALTRLHRTPAPSDRSFTQWAAELVGQEIAARLARMAGVFSFDHDPARLSAEFVRDRLVRVTTVPSPARFVTGGWSALVARLADRARALGARIETGTQIEAVPKPPVILALPMGTAAALLDDASLTWTGTTTALFDLGLEARRAATRTWSGTLITPAGSRRSHSPTPHWHRRASTSSRRKQVCGQPKCSMMACADWKRSSTSPTRRGVRARHGGAGRGYTTRAALSTCPERHGAIVRKWTVAPVCTSWAT